MGVAKRCVGEQQFLLLFEPFDDAGGAILMATHALGHELGVAQRLVILANGRVIVDTPRGTLSAEEVHKLYALHTEEAS